MSLARSGRPKRPASRRTPPRRDHARPYRASDSAEAFRAALSQKGYILAKGDRRGFVVIDRYGDVHSLARQIEGVKTRELKAKLAPLADQLPTVDQARVLHARSPQGGG